MHPLYEDIAQFFAKASKRCSIKTVRLLRCEQWRQTFETMSSVLDGLWNQNSDDDRKLREFLDSLLGTPSKTEEPFPGYQAFLKSAHKSTGREHHQKKQFHLQDGRCVKVEHEKDTPDKRFLT